MQDVEAAFAKRLKEVREALKWSQARLAATLAERRGIELDPTAITRIERGQRGIALGEAHAIADVLGAGLEDMCQTSRARTAGELRRQLAAAQAQYAAAEENHYVAEVARMTLYERVQELQAELAAVTEQDQGEVGDEREPVPAGIARREELVKDAGGWYGDVEDPQAWEEDVDESRPVDGSASPGRGGTGPGSAASRKRPRLRRPKAPGESQTPAGDAGTLLPPLPPGQLAWRNGGSTDEPR